MTLAGHHGQRPGLLFGALVLAGIALSSTRARAGVDSCSHQHASGQREARAGHFKVASEELAACSTDPECPALIRAECAEFLANNERIVPTVIFSVTDRDGKQLAPVKVFSNDDLIADGLDGAPIALDPGKHRFRFVLPSGDVSSSDALIREGEKNRVISLRLEEPASVPVSPADPSYAAEPPLAPLDPPGSSEQRPSNSPQLPTSFWIASGFGAASLLSFGTFALLGRSVHSDLADCSPDCGAGRHADFDALRRNYLLADVSLGVAAVSLSAAAYLYFTNRDRVARAGVTTRTLPTLHVAMSPPSSKITPVMIAVARSF